MNRLSMLGLWLLCTVAAIVAGVWMLLAAITGSKRAWSLGVAHDQLANAAFGGNVDETISSRAGKAAREGRTWACVLCRFLDRFDKDHCEKNIEGE